MPLTPRVLNKTYQEEDNAEGRGADKEEASDAHCFRRHRFEKTEIYSTFICIFCYAYFGDAHYEDAVIYAEYR